MSINFSKGTYLKNDQAMDLAIFEAKKGAGFVAPNPQVGCVILDSENKFLAKGFHEKFGGPHAEINALKNLSIEDLKSAKVFVTLEPCAHVGKTPSCAKYLATLPIHTVYYGLLDPNPLVKGSGLEILHNAGIKTVLFEHKKDELEEVCEVFLKNHRFKKPFVSLKVATSIDGMLALKSGESRWITGEQSRAKAHFLRACHDAILVGVNTILIDDPMLNNRHPQFLEKSNKIIILDPNGRLLKTISDKKIFKCHKPEDIILVSTQKFENPSGVNTLKVDMKNGKLDLNDLISQLWDQNIKSIMVEGGARTLSAFLIQNCGDRIYQFIAPKIIGSVNGINWAQDFSIQSLNQSIKLRNLKTEILGQDVLLTGLF